MVRCTGFVCLAAAALSLVAAPRTACAAEPMPDASFLASASFEDLAGFDQEAVFDAEGLFSYDFASQGGPPTSFRGTIEVRGAPVPLVRVTGDFGPSPGEGTAYAHLDYAVRVAKTDPDAPDVPVPIRISAHAVGSLVRLYGATKMPRWQAWLSYRLGAGATEVLMGLPIEYTYEDSFSNEVAFEGTRSQLPGAVGRLFLTAIGEAYGTSVADWQGGTFDVTVDPRVRIDPGFTVEVNGTTRPGAEVYALELSEGVAAPEPGSLASSAVAIAALAGLRSRRPTRSG